MRIITEELRKIVMAALKLPPLTCQDLHSHLQAGKIVRQDYITGGGNQF